MTIIESLMMAEQGVLSDHAVPVVVAGCRDTDVTQGSHVLRSRVHACCMRKAIGGVMSGPGKARGV